MNIPLFPLNTVLFPDSKLQLRLFEPRYLDMISECLRTDIGFGICLIRDGSETGQAADFFQTGTYVKIVDWDQMQDGLLGITVKGERRFKVEQSMLRKDKLTMGKICFIDESETQVPESYQGFSDLLREITDQYELSLAAEPERFTEANWVSNRLVDLLPFEVLAKQALLEMNNVLNRFDYMQTLLEKMDLEDQKSSFSLN